MEPLDILSNVTAGVEQPNQLYYHTASFLFVDGAELTLFGVIPAVLFNPGDITYAVAPRPYYENLSGDYDDLQNGLDYDAYDSYAHGIAALYSYLPNRWTPTSVDPKTNIKVFNETLRDFLKYDYVGAADANSLVNFGLSPDDIFGSVIANKNELTDLVEAIANGEGADDAVKVDITLPTPGGPAQTGVSTGGQITLSVAYNVNISSLASGGIKYDLDNDLATSIVDGSVWYTENTANNTETFSSNISQSYSNDIDPNLSTKTRPTPNEITTAPQFILGTQDTDTFYNLGDGTTIIAGADAAGAGGYTLTVYQNGSTGGVSFSSPGLVPGDILPGGKEGHGVGITLPAGILASPNMGLLTAPGYRPDLVIVNSSSTYVDVTTQNEMVFAVGYDDTFNAGPVNATVIDLNTMAAHGQTTPVGGELDILRKQEPLLSEIEDLLEQISNRDALATLQASPYESQDFPGNAFQLSVFAGNAPSPTITAVNVHTLYGPGVDYAQNLVVSNPDSSNTSDPITFSLPATNDLGVELTNTRGFDLAVYGFANFIQGPSATSIVSQISNFYITPDIQNGTFVGGDITGTKDLSDGINLSGAVLGTGSLQNSTVTLISASTNSFVISGKTGGAITTNNINRISSGLDTLDITDFEGAGQYNSAGHLLGEFFTISYNGNNVTINSYTKYTHVLGGVALSGANAVVSYNGVSLNISGFASVYLEQQSGGKKKSPQNGWDSGARHDPIGVALGETGINLTNFTTSSTYFDFAQNGLSTLTSWMGADTGFLVIKSDNAAYGVSVGDGYELLGTGTASVGWVSCEAEKEFYAVEFFPSLAALPIAFLGCVGH